MEIQLEFRVKLFMSERNHQYVVIELSNGVVEKIHTIDMPVYGHQHHRNQYSSISNFQDKVHAAFQKHSERGDLKPPKQFNAMAAVMFDQGPNLSGWLNDVPQHRYNNVNDFYAVIGYERKKKFYV